MYHYHTQMIIQSFARVKLRRFLKGMCSPSTWVLNWDNSLVVWLQETLIRNFHSPMNFYHRICHFEETTHSINQRPSGIRQLSIRAFESISVIFPVRAILWSPEVFKGQRSIDIRCYYIFLRKRAVASGTMIGRRTQRISIDSLSTPPSKVPSASKIVKITVTGEISFHE